LSDKRQQLIETAITLFGEYGFHATGIDKIAMAASVSKKTMYHHFRSKDELILAALKHHDGLSRNHFMKSVMQQAKQPVEQLLALFDVAQDWFLKDNFHGCLFINAIGEFSESESEIREACRDYKRQMNRFIEELAIQADLDDPAKVAGAISILLEGSIVTAQVAGNSSSAAIAQEAAKIIIDSAKRAS
jgi:AcrR family transcriptional regulator